MRTHTLLYIVLNPARYLCGISGVIMKAGFASLHKHNGYISPLGVYKKISGYSGHGLSVM